MLVCAPLARDAVVISRALSQEGYAAFEVSSRDALLAELGSHTEVVILTQEALTHRLRDALVAFLREQPTWARLPLILTIDQTHHGRLDGELAELMQLGLVTVLQRPMRPMEFTTAIYNACAARQKQLEIRDHIAYQAELQRELNHRVKNTMATFIAVHQISLRQADDLESFKETFGGRIAALSAVNDMLHDESGGSPSLRTLCGLILAPYDSEDRRRISVEGPELKLRREPATPLGLILNELATNALKYGSLSIPEGKLAVTWAVEASADGDVTVTWRESDGPPVVRPEEAGYGSRFIRLSAARLGGEIAFDFDPKGFSATLTLPTVALCRRD